jgi:transcriptional regulator PpsR
MTHVALPGARSGEGRPERGFGSWRIEAPVQSFTAPNQTLGDLDAETVAAVISAAVDVALVIDSTGIILDISIPKLELASELSLPSTWRGQRWIDLVTEETQPKVRSLLEEAATKATTRWRQIYHPGPSGTAVPILYLVTQLSGRDRYIVIGRDMRSVATLQQRLVETQISMERTYSSLRYAETRYRVLFQTSPEPVLIVDSATDKLVDANPAAVRVFGETDGRTIGRSFPSSLTPESRQALQSLSIGIRAGLTVEDIPVKFIDNDTELVVSTQTFRQGNSGFYLLRFTPPHVRAALPAPSNANVARLSFHSRSPDGYVIIDKAGRILSANPAFLQLVQVANEDQARGELLERWFGHSGVELSVLISNVRQHGSVTMFATLVRGEFGTATNVEISAVALADGDRPTFGLAVRNVERRIVQTPVVAGPHSMEQIKDLIGRVSLKDMVRESTDVIERLCIEAALDLTGDNRALAAEMLGLSRQSLYVKLRRYDLASDVDAANES